MREELRELCKRAETFVWKDREEDISRVIQMLLKDIRKGKVKIINDFRIILKRQVLGYGGKSLKTAGDWKGVKDSSGKLFSPEDIVRLDKRLAKAIRYLEGKYGDLSLTLMFCILEKVDPYEALRSSSNLSGKALDDMLKEAKKWALRKLESGERI